MALTGRTCASPTVSSAAAISATRASGDASADHGKNTSVWPTRRSTNCVSRGYWIAPVPAAEVRREVPADAVRLVGVGSS